MEKLACPGSQAPMVYRDILELRGHQDQKETEVHQECEDHRVTQVFPEQREIEANGAPKEKRERRGLADTLVPKETKGQKEKMVHQEIPAPRELKGPRDLRGAVVFLDR